MSQPTAGCNLGFLTVLHEPAGFVGGYLLTNQWGRPLEFRLSTVVQPNRVQQILYAQTLDSYVCAELIGKTLVEKCTVQPQLIVTDTRAVVELRNHLPIPVALFQADAAHALPLATHPQFPADATCVRDWQARLGNGVDLGEPFVRIRDAIAEARKMGVTSRG